MLAAPDALCVPIGASGDTAPILLLLDVRGHCRPWAAPPPAPGGQSCCREQLLSTGSLTLTPTGGNAHSADKMQGQKACGWAGRRGRWSAFTAESPGSERAGLRQGAGLRSPASVPSQAHSPSSFHPPQPELRGWVRFAAGTYARHFICFF